MSKLGRRWRLTDTVIDKVCEAREIGATYDIAALYAGVSSASLMGWLKEGRELAEQAQKSETVPDYDEDELRILELLTRIEKADAREAINLLQVVDKAAQSDPAWAWKILQQRYPKDFIPPIRQEVTGADGGDLIITVKVKDSAE